MTYPPQRGMGAIAITTEYSPLAHFAEGFSSGFFMPKIFVDGHEAPSAGWGRTVLPVQPGQHRVHVQVRGRLQLAIGYANTLVDVDPGQVVELEYKAPIWGNSAGSLGPPGQSYNGLVALMVISVVLAVCAIVIPIIATML